MKLKKFFDFFGKKVSGSKKDNFIKSLFNDYDFNYIKFRFRFRDESGLGSYSKGNTEEDLLRLLDDGKIVYDGFSFDCDVIHSSVNHTELEIILDGLFNRFIMGDSEYNKSVSMSYRTPRSYVSNYSNKESDTSNYSKQLDIIFMFLEDLGIPYKDVNVNQDVSLTNIGPSYWPYITLIIKISNEQLEKLIDLVWTDDLKLPELRPDLWQSRGIK